MRSITRFFTFFNESALHLLIQGLIITYVLAIMTTISLLTKVFKPNDHPSFWPQTAWAILRAVVGIMMIHNGLDKLSDIQSFSQAYVEVIGLPFPIFFSYVAALTETIGAPLLAIRSSESSRCPGVVWHDVRRNVSSRSGFGIKPALPGTLRSLCRLLSLLCH
jgi:choline-glycine betaine transporter